jgi:hypothetical protein
VDNYNEYIKRLLKAELVKRGISTNELVKRLNNNGIIETVSSVNSKISRGTFSAAFLMQCLNVIGCKYFDIEVPDENFKNGIIVKHIDENGRGYKNN